MAKRRAIRRAAGKPSVPLQWIREAVETVAKERSGMKKVRVRTGGFFYQGRVPSAGEEMVVSNEAAESWEREGMAEILGDEDEQPQETPRQKAESPGPESTAVDAPAETAAAKPARRGKAG